MANFCCLNGKFLSFDCNDKGEVVGSFTDSNGNVHGFIFDAADWHQYDAAGSSQTQAFDMVQSTVINGVNNDGNIVGFFPMVIT